MIAFVFYGMDCFGTCGGMTALVFKVLRNGLLRHTYFTHVQTCDHVSVQSATEWTASVPVRVLSAMYWTASVYILYTCHLLLHVRVDDATPC